MARIPAPKKLAVPAVCLVIVFLAYSSQYLFHFIEPGPLTRTESIWFNVLVACIWWSYERACRVDPGRLPKSIVEAAEEDTSVVDVRNWCTKCEAVKPPRAHHCRQCKRCIPVMDHHCPWTSNCVSYTTFPHFLRFVFYATLSMGLLEYHLFVRGYALYEQRNLPSYLGPSMSSLAHLFVLILINTIILFALSILCITAAHSLAINTTMIESWEIERHDVLVERARYLGGYVPGPSGRRVRIKKQEFPYDIGIWKNIVQGMGTSNIIAWFLPFGGGPENKTGWNFEVNGFEDENVRWPPPDPDKMAREPMGKLDDNPVPFVHQVGSSGGEIEAFRKRQEADRKRWETPRTGFSDQRAGMRSSDDYQMRDDNYEEDTDYDSEYEEGMDGEAGWTNSDGDRLRDYGVDEEAELITDDDVPLGELIRRRRLGSQNK